MVNAAWLPPEALRHIASRRAVVRSDDPVARSVVAEITAAGGFVETGAGSYDLHLESGYGDRTGFSLETRQGVTYVRAADGTGLLHGFFEVVRRGEKVFTEDFPEEEHRPAVARRGSSTGRSPARPV